MSLTVSHTPAQSAALCLGRTSQSRLLRASAASTSTFHSRYRGQYRGFRFARWGIFLHSNYIKDHHGRHRRSRHKCVKPPSNKSWSWPQHHPGAEESRAAIEKIMSRCWDAATYSPSCRATAGGSHHPKAELWADELSGARPGRNIEDVERSAINHLFESHSSSAQVPHVHDLWQRPLKHVRDYIAASSNTTSTQADTKSDEVTPRDSIIDPITNRRVSAKSLAEENQSEKHDDAPLSSQSHFTLPKSLRSEKDPIYSDEPASADELEQYGQVEIDEKPWVEPVRERPNYPDLEKYKPVMLNEDDGSTAGLSNGEESGAYPDLDKYGPALDQEAATPRTLTSKEKLKKFADLGSYGPVEWNEPEGRPSPRREEAAAAQYTNELGKYGPVMWNEPDGKLPTSSDERLKQYSDLHRYEVPNDQLEDLDLLRSSDVRARVSISMYPESSAESAAHQQSLDDNMSTYQHDWDNANKLARTTVQQAKIRAQEAAETASAEPTRTLTGHYARDFPEEFSGSWSDLLRQQEEQSSLAECTSKAEAEIASFDESFPSLNSDGGDSGVKQAPSNAAGVSGVEPALNRDSSFGKVQNRRDSLLEQPDLYSKEPQGLELSYMEECNGQPTNPVFTKTYTTSDGMAKTAGGAGQASTRGQEAGAGGSPQEPEEPQSSESAKTDTSVPSQYKILAYDPTTQTVDTADTTSVVPDNAVPMTAPQVLERLSNPTKFLPHLGTLQSQGFEIISGGGDVLIFRKVRDVPAGEVLRNRTSATSTTEKASTTPQPRVNPIDMMGSQPDTLHSYSASPTGYVNYDNLGTQEDNKPLPPFRSRFGRRASGRPSSDTWEAQNEGTKPTTHRGRKILMGAVWVGGISYALGILGEHLNRR